MRVQSALLGFVTLLSCSMMASATEVEWWQPPVCPAKAGQDCPDKAWLENCLSDNLIIGAPYNGKITVTLKNNDCFLKAGLDASEEAQVLRRLQSEYNEPVADPISFISVSKGCR
jgi:hypothetical protein